MRVRRVLLADGAGSQVDTADGGGRRPGKDVGWAVAYWWMSSRACERVAVSVLVLDVLEDTGGEVAERL